MLIQFLHEHIYLEVLNVLPDSYNWALQNHSHLTTCRNVPDQYKSHFYFTLNIIPLHYGMK
jgi:hypothetical protein